jgi:hypothetical protein
VLPSWARNTLGTAAPGGQAQPTSRGLWTAAALPRCTHSAAHTPHPPHLHKHQHGAACGCGALEAFGGHRQPLHKPLPAKQLPSQSGRHTHAHGTRAHASSCNAMQAVPHPAMCVHQADQPQPRPASAGGITNPQRCHGSSLWASTGWRRRGPPGGFTKNTHNKPPDTHKAGQDTMAEAGSPHQQFLAGRTGPRCMVMFQVGPRTCNPHCHRVVTVLGSCGSLDPPHPTLLGRSCCPNTVYRAWPRGALMQAGACPGTPPGMMLGGLPPPCAAMRKNTGCCSGGAMSDVYNQVRPPRACEHAG